MDWIHVESYCWTIWTRTGDVAVDCHISKRRIRCLPVGQCIVYVVVIAAWDWQQYAPITARLHETVESALCANRVSTVTVIVELTFVRRAIPSIAWCRSVQRSSGTHRRSYSSVTYRSPNGNANGRFSLETGCGLSGGDCGWIEALIRV